MAETFLARIVVATRARLAERMAERSLDEVRAEAARQPPALDFAAALRPTAGGIRAIAEFKRASPSKGIIRANVGPRGMVRKYVEGNAAAISVLTEQDFFQGSLDDLRSVKESRTAQQTPILRKDFITDSYQIVEARAAGADSYLLIVALLDDRMLSAFIQLGRELEMEPLVEVHDAEEAKRAVRAGARVIGVNARDLRTFEVDTTLLRDIRPLIPQDRIVVAESGIQTMSDVARMRGYGAQAILVGETLMRAKLPRWALQQLIDLPLALRVAPVVPRPIIKLCGMRTPKDAQAAYAAGADMIGMVFAPGKRRITNEIGREIVQSLPPDMLTVGVFLAEYRAEHQDAIIQTVAETGIKMAQLCGISSASGVYFREMGVPTIRARYRRLATMRTHDKTWEEWRIRPSIMPTLFKERSLPLYEAGAAPLQLGGTGQIGDWEAAAQEAQAFPMLLAGGLNPDNVGDAIRTVQPWGVDVSSGIEGPDGQKDPARMRAFVEAVRAAAKTGEHEGHEKR